MSTALKFFVKQILRWRIIKTTLGTETIQRSVIRGTPQCGVLSTLLCNIAINPLVLVLTDETNDVAIKISGSNIHVCTIFIYLQWNVDIVNTKVCLNIVTNVTIRLVARFRPNGTFYLLHHVDILEYIIIILARTPEIGQGLGRILSCGARKQEQTFKWTYDYCGLRTTTLFHDILILP